MRTLISSTLIMGASVLAIALNGCSGDSISGFLNPDGSKAIATGDPAMPTSEAQPYGVDGKLNEQELTVLLHLKFPQSYSSIKERLGFPAKRDEVSDYYQIKGTSRRVAIQYEGDRAVGYQFSE